MSKDVSTAEITQIPADILKLWGKPPVASSEDIARYNQLAVKMANSAKPADELDWLWTKDMVDHTWDIFRLRQLKADLFEKYFELHRDDYGKVVVDGLEAYQTVNSLLISAEARRNGAYHEIRKRHERLASLLRKASDDIIDGDFTQHRRSAALTHAEKKAPVKKGTVKSATAGAAITRSVGHGSKNGAA
jgi:hypothetical protein